MPEEVNGLEETCLAAAVVARQNVKPWRELDIYQRKATDALCPQMLKPHDSTIASRRRGCSAHRPLPAGSANEAQSRIGMTTYSQSATPSPRMRQLLLESVISKTAFSAGRLTSASMR